MSGKRFKAEEIVRHYAKRTCLLSQGVSVADVIRRLGVTKITYYRWRREFGGMKVDQARKLKDLERENQRLKKDRGDLTVDNSILKEAALGNF